MHLVMYVSVTYFFKFYNIRRLPLSSIIAKIINLNVNFLQYQWKDFPVLPGQI